MIVRLNLVVLLSLSDGALIAILRVYLGIPDFRNENPGQYSLSLKSYQGEWGGEIISIMILQRQCVVTYCLCLITVVHIGASPDKGGGRG
jgi:hypothetical protein